MGGGGAVDPVGPLIKPTIDQVMSTSYQFTGPLLWLGDRLARNRERAGVHYPSDSLASRWFAGAIWALLTKGPVRPAPGPGVAKSPVDPLAIVPGATPPDATMAHTVKNKDLIQCPTFRRVLNLARSEWMVG
jgi:hypothetical protein